jgi:iron complex outermembrane receptor protein
MDAFISWNTLLGGQSVDWQFNIKNIFDSTYYTASCCTGTPFVNIGAGREFTLNAKLNF